jgi:hypothetical protein
VFRLWKSANNFCFEKNQKIRPPLSSATQLPVTLLIFFFWQTQKKFSSVFNLSLFNQSLREPVKQALGKDR